MASTAILSHFSGSVVKLSQLNPTASAPQSMPQLRVRAFQFRRGESLPEMHQAYWAIQSGYVRTVSWDINGNVTTLGVWGPGDILSSDFSRIQPYQMECLSKVDVDRVASPENLREILLHHHCCTEELLNIIHCRQISQRLLKMIAWLADRFGEEGEDDWIRINLCLTHQQLADLLGTTRVTVTRLLGNFQRAGLMRRLPHYQFMLRQNAENFASSLLNSLPTQPLY